MAWIAVDKDGTECIFSQCPERDYYNDSFKAFDPRMDDVIEMPIGSAFKLTGCVMDWNSDPVKLK